MNFISREHSKFNFFLPKFYKNSTKRDIFFIRNKKKNMNFLKKELVWISILDYNAKSFIEREACPFFSQKDETRRGEEKNFIFLIQRDDTEFFTMLLLGTGTR